MRHALRVTMLLTTLLHGGTDATPLPKRTLNADMTLTYLRIPPEVSHLRELFTEGLFYGRLRSNTFLNDTRHAKAKWSSGIGGSLLYQSAFWHGLGMRAGLYTSQNPWHMKRDDIPSLGAGKDTLSRYDVLTRGRYGMTVLAQASLIYRTPKSTLKIGRQLFESRLTASNDTKMIPNSFEGVSWQSDALPHSRIKLGYFTRQKLRDHTDFHSVLAYDGYRENDDDAMHRGLTKAKLDAAGIDPRLIVAQIETRSLGALRLLANYTGVPDLLHSMSFDACWRMQLKGGYTCTPAVRYIRQYDDGAGAIGGANLRGDTTGYKEPYSLDGELLGFRVDLKKGPVRVRLGYTSVADKADLVAPWRGFPTGGFSRAMGQYNWYAGTVTKMVRLDLDLEKAGLLPGTWACVRCAAQDFDDAKPGTPADSDVIEIDLMKRFASLPGFFLKARFAYIDGHAKGTKADPTHGDYRLEINYLF